MLRPTLRMLAPGSPSHCARKGAGSDFGRARLASGHTCEPSSSSRASSILTGSSVLLQTGQVESYVPLSFCLRRNLRRCGAAKDGLFVASESHNANLRVTGLQTADRPVIVNSYFSSLGLQACRSDRSEFYGRPSTYLRPRSKAAANALSLLANSSPSSPGLIGISCQFPFTNRSRKTEACQMDRVRTLCSLATKI